MGEGRRSGEMSRYTVEDAAAVLGMTTGAVRNRLSQGTLRSVEEHGTVYVLLPADTARDMSSALMAEMRDRMASLERELEWSGALVSGERKRIASLERELEESSALVSGERERVASLERELERKDAILRNIAEAMKDISSPTEQPGRPPVLQP
jgi:predicted RNase H-like nuclease (RuvC/YqgF family)